MVGLILCAGLGTRLKEETKDKPKCMVDVCGKPILERVADYMEKEFGVDRIVVNLHLFPEVVMKYFGQRFMYLYEPVPMGETNTVTLVRRWLGGSLVTMNGDTLILGRNPSQTEHCGISYYDRGTVGVHQTGLDFIDIGTPEGLKKAREYCDHH